MKKSLQVIVGCVLVAAGLVLLLLPGPGLLLILLGLALLASHSARARQWLGRMRQSISRTAQDRRIRRRVGEGRR